MSLDVQTLNRAKQQAYRFLAYRSQSSGELKVRLERRGHTAAVIDEVLRQLGAEGYIDDRRFALDWARYRLQAKPMGRRRLCWELQRRSISVEESEEILRQVYAEYDEVALAEEAARRRLGAKDLPRSAREGQRFARYLTGLGFETETIATVLSRISHATISLEIVPDNRRE